MDDQLREILTIESWCFANKIYIYPRQDGAEYIIEINYKGTILKGKIRYKMDKLGAKDVKWWEAIYVIRKNYYDRQFKTESPHHPTKPNPTNPDQSSTI